MDWWTNNSLNIKLNYGEQTKMIRKVIKGFRDNQEEWTECETEVMLADQDTIKTKYEL